MKTKHIDPNLPRRKDYPTREAWIKAKTKYKKQRDKRTTGSHPTFQTLKEMHKVVTEELTKPTYHCTRCDKDVIDGRCECLSSPSPWELKAGAEPKPSNLPWVLVLLILSALVGYHFMSMKKIAQQEETIDSLIEMLEEVTAPLPQGDGEIETPGVLPPKDWVDPRTIISAPSGNINMNQIINAVIGETQTF